MKRNVMIAGFLVECELVHKAVKNINLRIRRGEVYISVPRHVPFAEAEKFLQQKASFILSAIEKQNERQARPGLYAGTPARSGDTVRLFGSPFLLTVEEGKPGYSLEKGSLTLFYREDAEGRQRKKALTLLAAALTERFVLLFDAVFEAFVLFCGSEVAGSFVRGSVFEKNRFARPELAFRAMTSRWGSCHAGRYRLTFSHMLFEKEPAAVKSVIAHELVHLLVGSHDARFHACLDFFWPENRQADRQLRS